MSFSLLGSSESFFIFLKNKNKIKNKIEHAYEHKQ
jgi:hypothetical protein